VSGLAAGFVTGTATAALAELQPRGDRQAAAIVATGSNMTGLGLGTLIALIGATSCRVFITAAVGQAVSARLPGRASMIAGLPLMLVSLAALEASLLARVLWLFLAGTVVGGGGVGLTFRGGLSEVNRLAEPRHRAAVVSTFFAAAYAGLGLPSVLTGLISQLTSAVDASVYTAAVVGVVIAAATVVVVRAFGVARPGGPPAAPSDSWCRPAEPSGLAAPAGSTPLTPRKDA
jgi:hypothetical protein